MNPPHEPTSRFDKLKQRLAAVHAQLELAREDGTLVVDAGDLDEKCRRYREKVDRLLELPPAPNVDDMLVERLVSLSVAADDLAACCADLKGPLDRLISAVHETLPDDPKFADDAS